MSIEQKTSKSDKILSLGRAVLQNEAQAIQSLIPTLGQNFVNACHLMLECKGRIIVSGMGKSGHIGNKIAATLASTGTPAFSVHPAEAGHGDLGMITQDDVMLALSNSGETAELLNILPLIKRLGVPLIAITGNENSTLSDFADVTLLAKIDKEACPLGLAPTTSTTAQLALGDALAISLLESRGFTADDFARSHPGGKLGKQLLLRVSHLFHTGDSIPKVSLEASLQSAIIEMTAKHLGMTTVVNADDTLAGIFTDGDLRRALNAQISLNNSTIESLMTTSCKTATEEMLATEALRIMQENRISSLVITDKENKIKGILHLHDCIRAGIL